MTSQITPGTIIKAQQEVETETGISLDPPRYFRVKDADPSILQAFAKKPSAKCQPAMTGWTTYRLENQADGAMLPATMSAAVRDNYLQQQQLHLWQSPEGYITVMPLVGSLSYDVCSVVAKPTAKMLASI
jgi:hypothetical protein